MPQEQNQAAALNALLDERNRYEGWIAALQGRKASTPAPVYDRVHSDYAQRLASVVARLSEHTGELQQAADTLATQLGELRASEADRLDARHEAELRAAVGEFSEAEWQSRSAEADGEIAAIAEERRATESQIAELRSVLALTIAPRASVSGPEKQADAVPPAAPPEAEPPPQSAEPAPSVAAQPEAPTRSEDSAEAAGTADIVWVPDVPAAAPAPPAAAAPSAAAPTARPDRIPFKPRAQGWPDQAPRVSEMYDGNSTTLRQDAPAVPTGQPAAPPVSAPTPGPGKSLQCPECGAANSATEWYCERCGGELAAL